MTHPLKAFRNRTGLSLGKLARMAGTTKASLSRIERGEQTPSLDLMARIKNATGDEVTPNDFLNAAPDRPPSPSHGAAA